MIYTLIVDLGFVIASGTDSDDAFDGFTDRVYDELLALEKVDSGISDPDITASLAERKLSILMGVEAETLRDAGRLFLANVRTALHAAGCRTAAWPHFKTRTPDLPPARQVDFAGA